ncbi:hypothetical protein, partial [Streptomyces phaeochromogenes]
LTPSFLGVSTFAFQALVLGLTPSFLGVSTFAFQALVLGLTPSFLGVSTFAFLGRGRQRFLPRRLFAGEHARNNSGLIGRGRSREASSSLRHPAATPSIPT